MKNIKMLCAKTCFVLFAITAIFTGCKKNDVLEENVGNGIDKKKKNGMSINSAGDGLNDLLGYGYDVTGEFANSSAAKFAVIDIARLKTDQPIRVEWDLSSKKYGEVIAGENARTYTETLTDKLGANLSIKDTGAGSDVKIPFFKGSINASSDNTSFFSSKYIYSSYALKIQQKRVKFNANLALLKQYLHQAFIDDVQNGTPQSIVNSYGTHILSDIVLGAKLDILYTSETSKSDVKTAATSGIEFNILGIFGFNTSQTSNTQSVVENTNQKLYFKTVGGEPSVPLNGNLVIGATLPTLSTQQWETSSSLSNAEMIDISEGGLIPIWDLISDPVKSTAVKEYVTQYLLANQVKLAGSPIHQYYSGWGDHFYTKTQATPNGYWYEGVAFNAYPNVGIQNTIPIHRYYNPGNGDHYYPTAKYNPMGYVYEGIEFYAYQTSQVNTSPVHVYYGAGKGDHYYTTVLSTPYGYVYQGVAFYVPN